jgi:hypothetical protein
MKQSLLITMALLATGCGESVAGSGHMQTQSPAFTGASAVELSGFGELHIVQGATDALNITTDDNLLPLLETSVRDKVLVLGQRGNLKPSHSIVYQLSLKEIKSIQLSGAGTGDLSGLKGDELSIVESGAGTLQLRQIQVGNLAVTLSGTGQITVSGVAAKQVLTSSGVGNFDGKALAGESVTVSISGAGNAVVNASKTLDAQVSGVGSVTYFGKPQVTQKVSGVGTVSPGGS